MNKHYKFNDILYLELWDANMRCSDCGETASGDRGPVDIWKPKRMCPILTYATAFRTLMNPDGSGSNNLCGSILGIGGDCMYVSGLDIECKELGETAHVT